MANPKISKYFTRNETLWLPSWQRLATPADGLTNQIVENIALFAARMDAVREILGQPILVHVWYRPPKYNREVKGAPSSLHLVGRACDFSCPNLSCDEIRSLLVGHLSKLKLRMEDLPGSSWVHIDDRPCLDKYRYFKP